MLVFPTLHFPNQIPFRESPIPQTNELAYLTLLQNTFSKQAITCLITNEIPKECLQDEGKKFSCERSLGTLKASIIYRQKKILGRYSEECS